MEEIWRASEKERRDYLYVSRYPSPLPYVLHPFSDELTYDSTYT